MLILAVLAAALQPADSPWLKRDLEKLVVEYLVVAPPAFANLLDDLCRRRAADMKVAVVRTDDIAAKHGEGAEGIAKLVGAAKPRFLLLAGDAETVPTFRRKSAYLSGKFLSDPELATDHLFGAVTGRFPADTADELKAMVDKTLWYGGPRSASMKIAFVSGEGGFGEMIDALLERQFAAIVTNQIPPSYDVEVAHARPTSRYCFFPPKFNENALRLLNDGPLFFVYVGHGMRTGFDDMVYGGKRYPIFGIADAAKVDVKGTPPIMVAIACNTGEYDSKAGDAIGEDLFKRPRGPVAFIGGTRATQPYGNALLGQHLVDQIFQKDAATLGEALFEAKKAVLSADPSPLRKQADAMASLIQGPSSLEPMRQDVIMHYNLLGDPALIIARPKPIVLETEGEVAPGGKLRVKGRSTFQPVFVSFECARSRFYHPTYFDEPDSEKRMGLRYANANNKVITYARATVTRDGFFEAELTLPQDLTSGRYHVKVHASGQAGSKDFEYKRPE